MANFINGTGLVRNKDIPGFDTLDMSAENAAFGSSDAQAVLHYSASIARLLQDNYDSYKADQHTSFSVAYNICLAAQMAGSESDHALVWAMGHGSNEGTVTGTFVDWIHEICSFNRNGTACVSDTFKNGRS